MSIEDIDDGNCIAGITPRQLSEAKIGDMVNITMKDGKSWFVEVVKLEEWGFHFVHENFVGNYDYDSASIEIIVNEENSSVFIEMAPEIVHCDNCIEFQNYDKQNAKLKYLLLLTSLHGNKLTDSQLDNIIGTFRQELGIR